MTATLEHLVGTEDKELPVPGPDEVSQVVVTARVVEIRGLLARVAVLLNPYAVRELHLSLQTGLLRVVVGGSGFDAGRVVARLEKVIGVVDVQRSDQ